VVVAVARAVVHTAVVAMAVVVVLAVLPLVL
jgi:hypothetical protein